MTTTPLDNVRRAADRAADLSIMLQRLAREAQDDADRRAEAEAMAHLATYVLDRLAMAEHALDR